MSPPKGKGSEDKWKGISAVLRAWFLSQVHGLKAAWFWGLTTDYSRLWIRNIIMKLLKRPKIASCFLLLLFLPFFLLFYGSSLLLTLLDASQPGRYHWRRMLLAVSRCVSAGDFPGLQNVFLASAKANGSRRWTRATGKSQAGWLPTMQSSLDGGMSGSCERKDTAMPELAAGTWQPTAAIPASRAGAEPGAACRSLLPALEASLVWWWPAWCRWARSVVNGGLYVEVKRSAWD